MNEVILADIDGKKVWLHGDRNGFLYSIERLTQQCVWTAKLSRVNWTPGFGENCRPIMAWEEGGDPAMDVVYDRRTPDIAPSLDGGKEWHPMSYSKRTNMVYVPTYNFSMDLQAKKQEWKRGEWYPRGQGPHLQQGQRRDQGVRRLDRRPHVDAPAQHAGHQRHAGDRRRPRVLRHRGRLPVRGA